MYKYEDFSNASNIKQLILITYFVWSVNSNNFFILAVNTVTLHSGLGNKNQ